jgi:hypothetical protein
VNSLQNNMQRDKAAYIAEVIGFAAAEVGLTQSLVMVAGTKSS